MLTNRTDIMINDYRFWIIAILLVLVGGLILALIDSILNINNTPIQYIITIVCGTSIYYLSKWYYMNYIFDKKQEEYKKRNSILNEKFR